jgi:hypothetical protein
VKDLDNKMALNADTLQKDLVNMKEELKTELNER